MLSMTSRTMSAAILRTSIVVEKAIDSWLACKDLYKAGLRIKPRVEPTVLIISLARNGPGQGILRGVKATAGTICKGSLPVAGGPAKDSLLGATVNFTLPAVGMWNIVCERTPVTSAAMRGARRYPETNVILDTTEGPFSMTLPEAPEAEERWASEIGARIGVLEANVRAFEASQKGTIKECRVCFHRGGTGAPGNVCAAADGYSPWSAAADHTPAARLGETCTLSWKLECR